MSLGITACDKVPACSGDGRTMDATLNERRATATIADLRLACDTGGTFTDLVVEDADGLRIYKTPTTPDDPAAGVLNAIALAARDRGLTGADFLARGSMFIHGTTRAINAILTGQTARTAFLTTKGHPDVLVFREGGKSSRSISRCPILSRTSRAP